MTKRLLHLDIYRGLAVVLMVIFHFAYDLHYFGFIDADTTKVAFWIELRLVILSLFLSAVGMSLYLVYSKKFNPSKYKKRLLLLGIASVIISVVTYFIFPKTWIYFGVLHMIFVASLIGPIFTKKPNVAGALGVFIIALYLSGLRMTPLYDLLQAPLYLPMYHTEDLVPLIPWFGVVLLGVFAMHHKLLEIIPLPQHKYLEKFSWIGKHTLAIYLIHQPVLFAILASLAYIIK